jgi:hypothetical protein
MDHAVNDRRDHARFGMPLIAQIKATLRPGNAAVLVNLSVGGALVHSERPLRPGSRIQVQLGSPLANSRVAAQVVRCGVAAIGAGGVTYGAALKFEVPCDLPWGSPTHDG